MNALAGIVALGDSITNGQGDSALGVHCQSWTQWLAEAMELPFTKLARNGATVASVCAGQLPQLRGSYELGVLYAGVNDVRTQPWHRDRFAADYERVLEALGSCCALTAVCTIPEDLGRPRAGTNVLLANGVIRVAARRREAVVIALDDLAGWRLVLPDAVHLTALGQLELADRAALALGLDLRPSSLAEADAGVQALLKYAVFGRGAALARDLRRRHLERLRRAFG